MDEINGIVDTDMLMYEYQLHSVMETDGRKVKMRVKSDSDLQCVLGRFEVPKIFVTQKQRKIRNYSTLNASNHASVQPSSYVTEGPSFIQLMASQICVGGLFAPEYGMSCVQASTPICTPQSYSTGVQPCKTTYLWQPRETYPAYVDRPEPSLASEPNNRAFPVTDGVLDIDQPRHSVGKEVSVQEVNSYGPDWGDDGDRLEECNVEDLRNSLIKELCAWMHDHPRFKDLLQQRSRLSNPSGSRIPEDVQRDHVDHSRNSDTCPVNAVPVNADNNTVPNQSDDIDIDAEIREARKGQRDLA
ncbi:hypothetical protein PTKIN_Ptkin13bG0175200 [Pterospermum kingtungense]